MRTDTRRQRAQPGFGNRRREAVAAGGFDVHETETKKGQQEEMLNQRPHLRLQNHYINKQENQQVGDVGNHDAVLRAK